MAEAYLLDSQIIIWSMKDPHRIPPRYRDIIARSGNVWVSVASIWEIETKRAIGKLDAPDHLTYQLAVGGVGVLDIRAVHAVAAARLPFHHSDPFDRLLIAQAQVENLSILTSDRHFALYDVALV